MMRQYELVERVTSYDPHADEAVLNRAYVYAMMKHGEQQRADGTPYFHHPLEAAGILTEYRLDSVSVIATLLHDVVEDTADTEADRNAVLDEIEQLFGEKVRHVVDGVTKLSKIRAMPKQAREAENLRKLVVALSQDIRVLVVKLADRLHNMRTLGAIRDPEKRRRIAEETMVIYAPLAERIGMHRIKDELEDRAFSEMHPEAREAIEARLTFLRTEGENLKERIEQELRTTLEADGLTCEVTGRVKTPYSIWRKMQKRHIAFEQLSDIVAFRIIVKDLGDCYRALGVLHGRYSTVPGRFKDYISTPKENGYRSIHSGLIGPGDQRIEVQIRTREMHDVAENGVAAHWVYKQDAQHVDGRQFRWVRDLIEVLAETADPAEVLEHSRAELFADQVFCFSPKGELIGLPAGATPVDFAYKVHTEVGDTCVGAKINGHIRPLSTPLKNGDQVEVLTSKKGKPSLGWLDFVVTGKARSRITRFRRLEEREQYLELGRQIVARAAREAAVTVTEKGLNGVLAKFKCKDVDDLYVEVGAGHRTGREVVVAVYPGLKEPRRPTLESGLPEAVGKPKRSRDSGPPVQLKGLIPGMAVHFARCCHPVPGDRIVGIISTGKGVTVHTIDCENLENFQDSPERWLDVAWELNGSEEMHAARLHVIIANEPGSLGAVSTVIGKNGGNITDLKFTARSADFYEMLIDVDVQDVRHLTNIIAALRADPSISSVERARG